MSQTETLLVMALGSSLTFVFFLLFGRIFWNIAMSAGARQRAKQVPIELLNLRADRDRMRAEHALMATKLELRLDDLNTQMIGQMAEVSRSRNRVQGLMADIENHGGDIKMRERENSALATQLEIKDAELASAQRMIDTLTADATRQAKEMAKLQAALQKLGGTLHDKETVSGQINSELRGLLDLPVAPKETPEANPVSTVEDRLRQRVAQLTNISADIARRETPPVAANDTTTPDATTVEPPENAASSPRPRDEVIKQKLAEAERQTAEMQKELRALDELLAATKPAGTPGAAQPKRSGPMANVVSLAQRIRAMQSE